MSFKTPFICDRRVFDKKGKWKNPNNDIEENIFYFVKENRTLVNEFINGKEQLKESTTICVFGSHPICGKDIITLNDGTKYEVESFILNEFEDNILVKDMLKPRVESIDVVLV